MERKRKAIRKKIMKESKINDGNHVENKREKRLKMRKWKKKIKGKNNKLEARKIF